MSAQISEQLVSADLTRVSQKKDEKGKEVFKGTLQYASGRVQHGIVKVFPPHLRDSAIKEIAVLERLNEDQSIESAEILDTRDGQELGFEAGGLAILEEQLQGISLALCADRMDTEVVQGHSTNLFAQLRAIGDDKRLIEQNLAYCGDISSTNVLVTEKGNFAAVDWGTRLGVDNPNERVTRRYVAPEVVVEGPTEISFVRADTYSLGCLLARALLGRHGYAEVVPFDEAAHHFLTYDQLQDRVDSGVHGFFRLALAPDSRDRSPDGARTAGEHYERLELLFRGFL